MWVTPMYFSITAGHIVTQVHIAELAQKKQNVLLLIAFCGPKEKKKVNLQGYYSGLSLITDFT